jgi:hypothetical protein
MAVALVCSVYCPSPCLVVDSGRVAVSGSVFSCRCFLTSFPKFPTCCLARLMTSLFANQRYQPTLAETGCLIGIASWCCNLACHWGGTGSGVWHAWQLHLLVRCLGCPCGLSLFASGCGVVWHVRINNLPYERLVCTRCCIVPVLCRMLWT